MPEQAENFPPENEITQSENEHSREYQNELQKLIQSAKNDLQERFDIDNLTTIEGVHLRKIAEDSLRRYHVIKDSKVKPKDGTLDSFDPRDEVLVRWFQEVYGLDEVAVFGDQNKKYFLEDGSNGEKVRDASGDDLLFTTQREALLYREEHHLADNTRIDSQIDDKFKQYLANLREKSQLP